jgi:hypothetical protein
MQLVVMVVATMAMAINNKHSRINNSRLITAEDSRTPSHLAEALETAEMFSSNYRGYSRKNKE